MIGKSCESNTKTIVEEHVGPNMPYHIHFDIVDDECSIPSTFLRQAVKQIEVIQLVVSPEIYKLTHSVMSKKLVTRHPIK